MPKKAAGGKGAPGRTEGTPGLCRRRSRGREGEAEAPGARKAAYAIAAPEPGTGGCAYPVGRLPYTE